MNKTSIDNEIYDDPNIMLNSRVPRRSVKQKWTYLRSDYYVHRAGSTGADPFMLYLEEIRQIMGTTEDIQVRYSSRLFEQIGHKTTVASSGNKHFLTISCHCQTYQNYQQP